MPMQTFNFPFHRLSDEYPESSKSMNYGMGYSYAVAPKGPDQLTFHLDFEAMWFWGSTAGVFNLTSEVTTNALLLQQFYETHRMYEPFIYVHPTRGSRTVRFLKPLPRLVPVAEKIRYLTGGTIRGHQVAPFTIQLIDNP